MNVYLGAISDTLLHFFIQVLCVVYKFLCVMTAVYVKIVSFLLNAANLVATLIQ